jgi:hypothetical protein
MRAVFLIAANLLREARWYVLLMVSWVVGLTLLLQVDKHPKVDDVFFLVRQEAAYGVVLALMMGAAAIHSDRKTRRILSILSKAVERRQYLVGLLLGAAYQALIFLAAVGICGTWMSHRVGLPAAPEWTFLVLPFCGAILGAAAGLMFASFLHPLFATAASGLFLLAQYRIEQALAPGGGPTEAIVRSVFQFAFQPDWAISWLPCAEAVVEAVILLVIAGLIFDRRDVAVAVD